MKYNWLVTINDEGVQCKILAGSERGAKKAAEEQKVLKNHAKIKFVFKFEKDPAGDYEDKQAFRDFLNVQVQDLFKKYGAASPEEFYGYNMRKRVAMGNGMEVLAKLDAKNYDEFHRNYSGIDGAIDILLSADRIMSGDYDRKGPGKSVSKLIRKLEISKE